MPALHLDILDVFPGHVKPQPAVYKARLCIFSTHHAAKENSRNVTNVSQIDFCDVHNITLPQCPMAFSLIIIYLVLPYLATCTKFEQELFLKKLKKTFFPNDKN